MKQQDFVRDSGYLVWVVSDPASPYGMFVVTRESTKAGACRYKATYGSTFHQAW